MIRSFIAFDIDDQSIITKISTVQGQLSATGADLKFVRPENVHITLRFLGNIPRNLASLIWEEMKNLRYEPFEVELKGLGVFSSLRNIRVVWIGITRGEAELKAIHDQLEPRLRGLGITPDKKDFNPHLTIARVKSGKNKFQLAECLRALSDYEFGVVKAEVLRLKQSILTPKGPIYRNLYEFTP